MSKGFLLFLQAKKVFRRELQKTEQEVRRSSGVIEDYKQVERIRKMRLFGFMRYFSRGYINKECCLMLLILFSAQICSQLTSRLERQQAAHREELDSLKVRIKLLSCFIFLNHLFL